MLNTNVLVLAAPLLLLFGPLLFINGALAFVRVVEAFVLLVPTPLFLFRFPASLPGVQIVVAVEEWFASFLLLPTTPI